MLLNILNMETLFFSIHSPLQREMDFPRCVLGHHGNMCFLFTHVFK